MAQKRHDKRRDLLLLLVVAAIALTAYFLTRDQLAGLFRGKKWGLFAGTLVGCCARFAIHYLSGITVYKIVAPTEFLNWTFSSPSLYSLVYNGSYMLPNTIISLVMAAVLYKPLKKYILGQDLR